MTVPDAIGRDPGDAPLRPRLVVSPRDVGEPRGDARPQAPPDSDHDVETIDAIRRGDEAIYERVFREHYAGLATFANRYLRDPEAAEDVAQEILGTLWIAHAALACNRDLGSYLYKAVRDRAIAMRNEREQDDHGASPAARVDTAEDVPSPEELVIIAERAAAIRRAIQQLPATRRAAFQLRIGAALPYAHIAELLRTTVRNVEVLIRRATRSVRASVP